MDSSSLSFVIVIGKDREYGGTRMSKKETYESQTEQYVEEILQGSDVELYDVEYVKEGSDWYLRVYIDKEGGVDILDCERVSRAMSELLDEKDYIPDAYIFEVSSPGLGRTLKKDKHLEKSLGEEIEIKTYKPIEKQKEFVGILTSYDKESITISMEAQDGTTDMTIARTDIAIVKLTIDF